MQKFDLNNPRTLASTGVMSALVLGLTLIHLTTTPTGGYVHLGDIAIYFASFAFGPWVGMVAGGLGAGLADVIGGAPQWAPLSLVVHGAQGFIAGWIVSRDPRPVQVLLLILAVVAGAVVVIGGYYAGESLIPVLGGQANAVGEIPGNLAQEAFGALGIAVYIAVARAYPRIRQMNS
jgi:energy-coupling factor transport system substrate-specific component